MISPWPWIKTPSQNTAGVDPATCIDLPSMASLTYPIAGGSFGWELVHVFVALGARPLVFVSVRSCLNL